MVAKFLGQEKALIQPARLDQSKKTISIQSVRLSNKVGTVMASSRRSSRMSNGSLCTQIRDWPAPTTRGDLLERYQPIHPPDEKFSSDLRRPGLHLNDFD